MTPEPRGQPPGQPQGPETAPDPSILPRQGTAPWSPAAAHSQLQMSFLPSKSFSTCPEKAPPDQRVIKTSGNRKVTQGFFFPPPLKDLCLISLGPWGGMRFCRAAGILWLRGSCQTTCLSGFGLGPLQLERRQRWSGNSPWTCFLRKSPAGERRGWGGGGAVVGQCGEGRDGQVSLWTAEHGGLKCPKTYICF